MKKSAALPIPTIEESEAHAGLRAFARRFFETYEATVRNATQNGGLIVDLPPALAEHFGKTTLHLVFENSEVTSDTDLVAYGSRVFDRIMAYLDEQAAVTVQILPRKHTGAGALMSAVQLRNASLLDLKLEETQRPLYVFNWHITYRSDDKHEELFTVVLDSDGERAPIADAGLEDGDAELLDLASLLADAEEQPSNTGVDEETQPKLPPMTQLVRLAETARKFAFYHADVRCVELEVDILQRLHKVLSRLTTYYQQQIDEVYESHDPDGEKRRALEEDLQRKIAEEVENHRLRVQVRLFSYAVLYVPIAVANLTVGDGSHSVSVQVVRDLYTGRLERPPCQVCGEAIENLVLDRAGHVCCDACIFQCETCQDVLCEDCGLHACPVCGKKNCETCSTFCWACGERACHEHNSVCPVCGDEVCHECQALCASCGQRQCRTHLHVDSVSGELICSECAVRCPGCRDFTAHLETCSISGQRFCDNCIVTCAKCGRPAGPGFYMTDPLTDASYCQRCLERCPTCGNLVAVLPEAGCSVCGQVRCGHCGVACGECGALLCLEHAHHCLQCGKSICPDHRTTCSVGGETLCTGCGDECAICARNHCAAHATQCSVCLQTYCNDCVLIDGVCQTCTEFLDRAVPVAMPDEPVAGDRRVQNVMRKHRWLRHGNNRYTIYVGTNLWGRLILVVAVGAEVIHIRRTSFFSRLLGRTWIDE